MLTAQAKRVGKPPDENTKRHKNAEIKHGQHNTRYDIADKLAEVPPENPSLSQAAHGELVLLE